jgi:hypothetical protein
LIDESAIILAGHCRLEAAKKSLDVAPGLHWPRHIGARSDSRRDLIPYVARMVGAFTFGIL